MKNGSQDLPWPIIGESSTSSSRHISGIAHTGRIASDISNCLLQDNPDTDALEVDLQSRYSLSPQDASHLIYEAVLNLNQKLFPPIISLELILTEGCNLACTYCFEKEMLGHKKMPLEVAKSAVDLLFSYSGDRPSVTITHFGGEPTLNFPAIQYATEYAEDRAAELGKSVNFNITTNGVLLNERIVGYFADHKIDVLLSLDGSKTTHNKYRVDKRGQGTFDRVLKGLHTLKEQMPWIAAKLTVMPTNASQLYEDVVHLHEIGVNEFLIGHASGVKWGHDDMNIYSRQLRKVFEWYINMESHETLRIPEFDDIESGASFGCRAGNSSMTVSIDGEISPCAKILALDNKSLLSKLGDTRHGLTHLRNRMELVSCKHVRSECEILGIAKDYHGGCFAENYEDNRNLFSPSRQGYDFAVLTRAACSGCNAGSKID
ncbi:uncharacterized protein SAMN04489712_1554 [Thermomonospora echinospora]|uniref:Radical SAM core domain-containing protein n=1 Tax=Thermomonospora echinospora TaxID=1992 RepID=A0A1H6ED41_9ACTN|nr:radical SAM protein [Thermomonospora echinospora]SEG94929.1 uncharacterized protein SAMN04489712_1554 [Thermomonospora echinospora]